jgi:hypothetical protein
MQSSGVSAYLKDVGRDVAGSLGDELKGVAKEKAVNFVKEQFGLGFTDELKSAGKDILGAVGDELKGAAKEKATSYIKEQLGLGMPMLDHSGGASALQLCAHTLTNLRKAANEFKRKMRKLNATDFLLMHAPWKDARQLAVKLLPFAKRPSYPGFIHIATETKREGGLSAAQKNRLRRGIMLDLHPVTSRMSRDALEEYIWTVADRLNVNWQPLLGDKTQKKRVAKRCERTREVGDGSYSPPKPHKKRAPSAYNNHISQHMRANPDGAAKERFAAAVADWNRKKARSASAAQGANTRRERQEGRREARANRERKDRDRIAANKQRNRNEYAERGRDPKVAAIRRTKIPKRSQAGRGAAYDSGSESDE